MAEDEFLPDGGGSDDGDPERRAVFITTSDPVPLRVTAIPDERAPDGECLGAFIDGRLVARCAMPKEAIERLMELRLFEEPVPLALLAYEEEPGLQCRLFALVPASSVAGEGSDDEPWAASVPRFEEAMAAASADAAEEDDEDELDDEELEDDEDDEDDDEEDEDDDEEALATILLGNIVRFAKDRKHPDDLTSEAVDVLQKIVAGSSLSEADARAIDDLLDSI
jgi:hypothetical protein